MDFFRPNIEKSITLPSPPLRDEDEISRMKDIIRNRTAEDVQSIRDHDEVPFYALKKYCEENGLKMFAFVEKLIRDKCVLKTDIYGEKI